jgi:hypothetical protein
MEIDLVDHNHGLSENGTRRMTPETMSAILGLDIFKRKELISKNFWKASLFERFP